MLMNTVECDEDEDRGVLSCGATVESGNRFVVRVMKSHGGGIGLTVKRVPEWGFVVISLPVPDSSLPGKLHVPDLPESEKLIIESPAERAGVRLGDILVQLSGHPNINSLAELVCAIRGARDCFDIFYWSL